MMTWVNQAHSVKTLPMHFGWRKTLRYDWSKVREEAFAEAPKTHSLDPSPDGTSKGDLRPKQKRTWVPEPDGFLEQEPVVNEDLPPFRSFVCEPKQRKRIAKPKLSQVTRSKRAPDGGYAGAGKRKASSAYVSLKPEGTGLILINGRPFQEYLQQPRARDIAIQPLIVCQKLGYFDIKITARGGGTYGQAGAISLAIARALISFEASFKPILRFSRLSIRDSRVVERKKVGKKKARRAKQWSKR